MRKHLTAPFGHLALILSSAILSACGGGGNAIAPPLTTPPTQAPSTVVGIPPAPGTAIAPGMGPPPVPPVVPIPPIPPVSPIPPVGGSTGAVFTKIAIDSTGATEQQRVPVTFGHVFAVGHVGPSQTVTGRLADGTTLPLQVDIKARHADGSVRHAILSAQLPKLAPGQALSIGLAPAAAPPASSNTTPAALLAAGFTSSVSATIAGAAYKASADQLLRNGTYETWLSGPLVNEWMVSAPLVDAAGQPHPHLTARFAIRAVTGAKQARVDVTVENNWAYEPAPQNFQYDAKVLVGGTAVYSVPGMTHYHHARWRKVFWWGAEPAVHIKHDTDYLIGTRALPNFDRSVVIPESRLAEMQKNYAGTRILPMSVGAAMQAMGTTGGREDIGLLPGWATIYLLSMDKRAKDVTLGTADLAGSWSSHYRDRNTGRPVSVADFPYMTILGVPGDTYNPVTKKHESFPRCATSTGCSTPNQHDTAHQPGFAFLPYLVTGDYYYLEELQFWAMYSAFSSNPGYRQNIKGLVGPDQVRGQAWSMRTLGEAAYITPDADRLKSHLITVVNNNLDYYNATYTNNANANKLGVITNGYSVVYNNNTGLAPWMDDFFTSAIGHVNDLGFNAAAPLLAWKSKFPIGRMTAPGTCWITGAMYAMTVRDSGTAPLYATLAEAWKASSTPELAALPCAGTEMAANLKLKVGEMSGYSSYTMGYPSNMQPALAYAADAGGTAGAKAWSVFMNRSVKPDYGTSPQFAIVPR